MQESGLSAADDYHAKSQDSAETENKSTPFCSVRRFIRARTIAQNHKTGLPPQKSLVSTCRSRYTSAPKKARLIARPRRLFRNLISCSFRATAVGRRVSLNSPRSYGWPFIPTPIPPPSFSPLQNGPIFCCIDSESFFLPGRFMDARTYFESINSEDYFYGHCIRMYHTYVYGDMNCRSGFF